MMIHHKFRVPSFSSKREMASGQSRKPSKKPLPGLNNKPTPPRPPDKNGKPIKLASKKMPTVKVPYFLPRKPPAIIISIFCSTNGTPIAGTGMAIIPDMIISTRKMAIFVILFVAILLSFFFMLLLLVFLNSIDSFYL